MRSACAAGRIFLTYTEGVSSNNAREILEAKYRAEIEASVEANNAQRAIQRSRSDEEAWQDYVAVTSKIGLGVEQSASYKANFLSQRSRYEADISQEDQLKMIQDQVEKMLPHFEEAQRKFPSSSIDDQLYQASQISTRKSIAVMSDRLREAAQSETNSYKKSVLEALATESQIFVNEMKQFDDPSTITEEEVNRIANDSAARIRSIFESNLKNELKD